ncbi:hypothetical protein [Aquimarina sp. 2201CG5-10]|uniref:hypothetical protein n=1 Tax=Aquimarina callyspongiae TaxID=3098150 RepID=UPI002AB430CE|nr:hypothetical protein [Aquimarina sp. 2201CG5-10]MDY8137593.1 hypothetical protein [Aquimarina sp. 2201CG5-10]
MKKTLTLEDWFVHLRIVSVTVIAVVISIIAKSSWYYFQKFTIEIPEARAVAAIFFGIATGVIVSLMSFHKSEKNKTFNAWVFYIANIILTALILNVFESADPRNVEFVWKPVTFYVEFIFLSLLIPTLEFATVNKWKELYHKEKEGCKLTLSDLEEGISDTEQRLNELKQQESELEQRKAHLLEEEQTRTCSKCQQVFGSKNAKNAHKCKIEDIPVISEEVKPQ